MVYRSGVQTQEIIRRRTAIRHLPFAIRGVHGHVTLFRNNRTLIRTKIRLSCRPSGVRQFVISQLIRRINHRTSRLLTIVTGVESPRRYRHRLSRQVFRIHFAHYTGQGEGLQLVIPIERRQDTNQHAYLTSGQRVGIRFPRIIGQGVLA